MKDLTEVFPSSVAKAAKLVNSYWELPSHIYVTENMEVAIALLDSASEETIIVFWSEEDNLWYYYTNCFGCGFGNSLETKLILEDWIQDDI